MNARLSAPRRFTLIEALVVVSIIALLAALLLPALSAAKERGRRTTCRSNLRQIGIAIHSYAGDFEGLVPPGDYVYGHDIWNRSSLTGTYQPTNLGYLLAEGGGYVPRPRDSTHIFYCPSMVQFAPQGWFVYDSSNSCGMQNWGRAGPVNAGYDYRDSLDDSNPRQGVTPWTSSHCTTIWNISSSVTSARTVRPQPTKPPEPAFRIWSSSPT